MIYLWIFVWLISAGLTVKIQSSPKTNLETRYGILSALSICIAIIILLNGMSRNQKWKGLFITSNLDHYFDSENLIILEKHKHPFMFQDKYHGEFNLTRSLLANGSIGLIEVTDNVLFSESLAYQLQMPEFKDIRYVYIDLEYAVDPAKKFNDRLEFWTQFLQSLMNHIDNLKLKNKDNHFLIIFDNLSNEHMKVLDSNKKKVFDKKIQSQMLLTLHEGFNNATILGILKDTSQQIEMRSN